MKIKLERFKQFARTILPHEADYLLSVHRFEEDENIEILDRLAKSSRNPEEAEAFNPDIDKRRYSGIIRWVNERLDAVDVDRQFEQINQYDQLVMTDSLQPGDEKALLKWMRSYDNTAFYFIRFYRVMLNFRHSLLIRMRYREYDLVNDYITQYRPNYLRSQEVYEELHQASVDIVRRYHRGQKQGEEKWEKRLKDIFHDRELDGLNRYYALIRLTFLYYNLNRFDKLREEYELFDVMLREGQFYSKRILINFYANRLLMYSRLDMLDEAEMYGYLSTRIRNTDYLVYVNNLSALLLRRGKPREAFELLQKAFPDMRQSVNFHNKTGFVSFYVKSQNELGQFAAAESYAEHFLQAYTEQVLEQRWHTFFTAFLQSVIGQGKFKKAAQIIQKYSLVERERKSKDKPHFFPVLEWYLLFCRHALGQIGEAELKSGLLNTQIQVNNPELWNRIADEMTRDFGADAKALMNKIWSELQSHDV